MNQLLRNWGKAVAGSKSRWVTVLVWVLVVAVLSFTWPQVNEEE